MQEKRKSPRKASLTRCVVDRLFSHDEPVPSRVINYSDHGLMIELDYPLPPGDAVAVQFPVDATEVSVYGGSTCIGMVRWCAPQDGLFDAMYGVGVELANRCSKRALPLLSN